MIAARLKKRLAHALVRTTTADRAYRGAEWHCVLEQERIALDQTTAPDFAAEARYLNAAHYSTPRVMTALIRGALYYSYLNVMLTPLRAIVLDTDNTYLETGYSVRDKFYWRYLYRPPVEEIPGVSFVLRSPANNFYHTLIDNLPRLYVLNHPRYFGLPVSLLVPSSLSNAEEYFLRHLLPSHVSIRTVERNRLYRLECVLFASYMSRQMCGYLPKAYLEYFLGRMLPRRQRRRCNRIYISRRRSPIGRRVLNEDEVVRMLNSFGFESVALETLPLDAQIELFFDAEAVVGVHGAGLTNLLFSDAAAVTELHPRRAVLPHYYFLCKAMGHDYRSLCSNASTRDSDIYVDVDALAATLREQLDGSPPQSASA